MPKLANFSFPLPTLKRALLWSAMITPMAGVVGSACALFLWALERATDLRFQHAWLLWLLPVAGVVVGYIYHWLGKDSERGNNLIIEQIHQPDCGVPKRMAPLVLLATVITHLFGGSAGREGTAVQMGGSISSAFANFLKLNADDLRIMLMAGVAAGFGSVFGTPLAGAIFALEVLTIGQIRYDALIPCLFASLIGDWTCHAWGIHHTPYHVAYMAQAMIPSQTLNLNWLLMAKVALAAIAFGLAARLFSSLSHAFSSLFKKLCPYPPLRPALGAAILIALVYILGTREYLGLGVSSPNPSDISIASLFSLENTHPWAWLWKLLFTTITLSAGFKGGEVTPLFFIGAALGSTLATLLGAPPDLFICLGFVAIFSGATNTPIACTIMGIELFGAANSIYLAAACFIAYQCSGHTSIYLAQHLGIPKRKGPKISPNTPLHKIPHP